MPPLLTIALLLAVVGAGIGAAWWVRGSLQRSADDRGDWEKTLAGWRNLRDQGVLTEEEYRKVRTLVEPRTRIGTPEPDVRHRPAAGLTGPDPRKEMN